MDAFIARQPIFDRHQNLRAFELLFRSGLKNAFQGLDADQASSKVIADSLLLHGLDTLTQGRPAFINVTRDLLVEDLVSVLPPTSTVLEILETTEPDAELVTACVRLRKQGFRIALDDFRFHPRWERLLDCVDIVKVDVLAAGSAERASLAKRLQGHGITLLAEKIETQAMFRETAELGYELFQGYAFARPAIVSGHDIPALKLHYLEMLREIHAPELDLRTIETIVTREIALTYKLLRYINASFFGWRGSVSSVHHALLLLGEREFRKWASVVALAGMAGDKPEALVTEALLRARFCEQLAPVVGLGPRADDLFITGMFSLLDAFLDRPLRSILEGLPVNEEVKAALLGGPGVPRDVLEIVVAYNSAQWAALQDPCSRLGISDAVLPSLYASAVEWVGAGPEPTNLRQAA